MSEYRLPFWSTLKSFTEDFKRQLGSVEMTSGSYRCRRQILAGYLGFELVEIGLTLGLPVGGMGCRIG